MSSSVATFFSPVVSNFIMAALRRRIAEVATSFFAFIDVMRSSWIFSLSAIFLN